MSAIRRSLVNSLRRFWPKGYLGLKTIQHLVVREDSYLYVTGWMRSHLERTICDRSGQPVPWMNHPVIAFLRERLNAGMDLFEYGSGFSTMFFGPLVNKVTSVEYDREWYERVRGMVGSNVQVMYVPKDRDGSYCRAIEQDGAPYDVVVIDGADRNNCMKAALERLSAAGVIVLDDSERLPSYQEAFDAAREKGFKHLTFEGMKSGGYGEMVHTTVFYRSGNCLGI